ncbi:MAG: hypothetical protein AB7G11_08030 [Phycisphaerales bacterium]
MNTKAKAISVIALACVCLAACDEEAPPGAAVEVKETFGGLGDTPGRFAYPRCLDADPFSNTLWVIDKTGRIQQIDPGSGKCLSIWKMPLTDNGKPTGCTIALDDDGRPLLYVADTHYHRVMVYRADEPVGRPGEGGLRDRETPTLVGSFGEYGTGPGQFIFPTDIAIIPGENGRGVRRIYVSEYGTNDRISVFGPPPGYACLFTFGTYGNDTSGENIQFDRPQSMIIAYVKSDSPTGSFLPDKQLIVADARNHRIGRFSLDGALIGWFGDFRKPGDGLGQFRIPYGLHDLGDGTALIAEFGNNRVQRIDLATGMGMGTWGRPGRGEGELFNPWAVTTLGAKAYVLDSGNNRILSFAGPKKRN